MDTVRKLQILKAMKFVNPKKTQNFIAAKLNGFTVVSVSLHP